MARVVAGQDEQLLDVAARGMVEQPRTSSGSCRCGWWVWNAQYLQCETHVRDSDSVTLREKVTLRRVGAASVLTVRSIVTLVSRAVPAGACTRRPIGACTDRGVGACADPSRQTARSLVLGERSVVAAEEHQRLDVGVLAHLQRVDERRRRSGGRPPRGPRRSCTRSRRPRRRAPARPRGGAS